MARRKTLSPRDEFGNRFVTYTNTPQEAILAQPDLRTTKQSVQTQRIAENNGGGDPSDNTFNNTKSTTPEAVTGRLASNTKETGVTSLQSVFNDVTNFSNNLTRQFNTPFVSEEQINNAKSMTNAELDAARSKSIQDKENENPIAKFSRFTSLGQAVDVLVNNQRNLQNTANANEARSRVPNLGERTLANLNEEVNVEQDEFGTVTIGGRRTQQQTIQDVQAIARDVINQEQEVGYRSTGNPRGSRSGISDVNAGKGNRGLGPTTRGRTPSSPAGNVGDIGSDTSGYTGFGIGSGEDDGFGSV